MPYNYDIFISYTRERPVGTWVHDFFEPLLEERLEVHLPDNAPRIFIDNSGIPVGTNWAAALSSALVGSKVLIPVWSANFFRSQWCIAEWQTFLQRVAAHGPVPPLIYPVLFGGQCPQAAAQYQYHDLSRFGLISPAFKLSQDFVEFEREVDRIARVLVSYLGHPQLPPHDPAWGAVLPVARPAAASLPLPRM